MRGAVLTTLIKRLCYALSPPSGSLWFPLCCALWLCGSYVSSVRAQEVLDPIRCWWRTSAGAVVIGESFQATLTCAAREQESVRTVPDESRLSAATIQLSPFEILGGSHPPDVRRGSRRFFQYDYQLRIISRDAIGQDVNVPSVTVSYRVHSRVGAAARAPSA